MRELIHQYGAWIVFVASASRRRKPSLPHDTQRKSGSFLVRSESHDLAFTP
jgi:hypothetical protein